MMEYKELVDINSKLVTRVQQLMDSVSVLVKQTANEKEESLYYLNQLIKSIKLLQRIKEYNGAIFKECVLEEEINDLSLNYHEYKKRKGD